MSNVRTPESVRRGKVELSRLAWAFVLSLSVHVLVFGTFQMGKRFGWWQSVHWPRWMQAPKRPENLNKLAEIRQKLAQEEIPLVFVEVTPEQATPEPPKQAKFYSNQNSKAA